MKIPFILLAAILFGLKAYSQITPGGSVSFCQGGSVVLTAPAGGSNYVWDSGINKITITGQTAKTYTATVAGTYRVIYTINGKRDTTQPVVVTVNPNPTPSFSYTPTSDVCGINTFTFTANKGAANYSWSFQGSSTAIVSGNPATVKFDSATGTGDAALAVILTETNGFGCSGSDTQKVTVHQIPNDSITSPNSTITQFNGQLVFSECAGTPTYNFQFLNASSTFADNKQYLVSWGDGTPATAYTNSTWPYNGMISHTYSTGSWTLTLTTTSASANGCVNTRQYGVFIGTNPSGALVSPGNTNICVGGSLTFPIAGAANNPSGTLYSVVVTDGSSNIYNTQTFSQPPPAAVTQVFNTPSCGLTDQNGIKNALSIIMTITNPCSVLSDEPSISPVGTIRVSEKPAPTFVFSPRDTVCVNSAVNIMNTGPHLNTSTGNSTCIVGLWQISPSTGWALSSGTMGNGNGSNTPSNWTPGTDQVGVNFTTPGTYTVTLKEGSGALCGIGDTTETICVNPVPTASFTVDNTTGCAPLKSTATTTTNTPNCGHYTYSWTVDYTPTAGCVPTTSSVTYANGTSDTSRQPSFVFDNPGVYTVSLLVYGPDSTCTSAVAMQQVTVMGKPNITSLNIPTSICQSQSFSPTADLSCYIDNNTTYSWSFPGGVPSSSTQANPGPVSFVNAGAPQISLTAHNVCGPTTLTQQITINAGPTIAFGSSAKPLTCGAQNGSISLTGLVAATPYTMQYTGPSGTVSRTITASAGGTLTITGLAAGTYTNITASTTEGCGSNSLGPITITDPNPPPTPVAASNSPVCQGSLLTLNATSTATGNVTYSWSGPPGANFSNQPTTSLTALANYSGSYTVTTTVNNCTSSAAVMVTVNPTPAPTAGSNSPICQGGTLNFTSSINSFAGNVTYAWAGPQGFKSAVAAPLINNAVPAQSGLYTLTVTSVPANCQSAPVNVNVLVNPVTVIRAGPPTNPTNCGTTTGAIKLAGLLPAATYTVQYSGPSGTGSRTITSLADSTLTITGLTAGTYANIIATTAAGCGSNTVGPITLADPNPPPTPVVTSNSPVCEGSLLTLNATSTATGNITYSWSGPPGANFSTQASISLTAAANFGGTYTVTTTVNNCTSSAPVIVTVNPTPAPTAGSNSHVCQGGTVNFTSSTNNFAGNVTYAWAGPQGFTSTVANPVIINAVPAQSGQYTLTVTSVPANCQSAPVNVNVVINPVTVIKAGVATNPTSCGSATGTITLAGLIPTAPYTIQYTGPAGLVSRSITSLADSSLTITGLTAGTYTTITATTAAGCASNAVGPVTLADPSPPAAPLATSNSPVCAGAELDLFCASAPVGAVYSWTGPFAGSSLQNPAIYNAAPSNSGTYYVTVTVNKCTSLPGAVNVTVNANASVPTATANTPVCSGDTLNLTASSAAVGNGPITYQWTGPGNFTSSLQNPGVPNMAAALAGSYCVAAFNAGCPSPTQGCVNVTVNPTPAITGSYSNPTSCGTNTGSITLSGLTQGAYTLTYLYNNQVFKQSPYFPNLQGNIVIYGLQAGIYSHIQVTTANNCPSNELGPDTLVDIPLSVPSISSNAPVCAGSPLQLNAYVANAQGVVNYFWTGPGITPALSNLQNPLILAPVPADGGTYTVVATINGCSADDSIAVTVNAKSIGGHTFKDTTVCYGVNAGTIQLSGYTGGVTSWEVSTDNGGSWQTISNTAASIVFNNLKTTAWYRAVVQNGACDTAHSDITIITVVSTVGIANAGPNQILCNQQSANLLGNSPVVGTGLWTQLAGSPTADINFPNVPNTAVTQLQDTAYSFLWTITGPPGCGSSSAMVQIVNRPAITQALAGPEQDICDFTATRSITLAANEDASRTFEQGLWSVISQPGNGSGTFGNDISPNSTFTFSQPGIYTLEWTISDLDSACAPSGSSMVVNVSNPPAAAFTVAPTRLCAGDSVMATNNSANANVFNWYWGDGLYSTFDSGTHTYTSAGTYTIKLVAENLQTAATCTDSTTQTVTVLPLPAAGITVTPALIQQQPDNTFTFEAVPADTAGVNYLWNMGDRSMQTRSGATVTYQYSDTGTYTVKLIASDFASGCHSNDSVIVTLLYVPGYLQVPDAICPGCAKLELRQFLPLGKGLVSYHLTISTIWGKVLFESTALNADGSPQEAWTAQYNGQPIEQAAYRWQIEARFINGTEWRGMLYPGNSKPVKSGFLTIIK